MTVAGVILAGGQATRMGGGDKTLLTVKGETLLQHCLGRLRPQVEAVVLNANGDPQRFVDHALPVVADSVEGFAGPLAGVLAGLDWAAAHDFDAIVSVAGDTPFFPHDLVARLAAQAAPFSMAATEVEGRGLSRHPTFGYWPVALREELRNALTAGVRKVVAFADQHGCAWVEFDAQPFDPFFNVNTPADLSRAEALL